MLGFISRGTEAVMIYNLQKEGKVMLVLTSRR